MKRSARVGFASPGGSVIPGALWEGSCASTEDLPREPKIGIITIGLNRDLSEIKLKRTDTTLDLSQKAEERKPLANDGDGRVWVPSRGEDLGGSGRRTKES